MKIIGSVLLVLMFVAGTLASTDSPPLATAGGSIASIDSAAGTFTLTVAEPKGGTHDVMFVLADDSKIVKGGAAVALADLKEGEKVTVTYHAQDGKNVVVNVGVQPAA